MGPAPTDFLDLVRIHTTQRPTPRSARGTQRGEAGGTCVQSSTKESPGLWPGPVAQGSACSLAASASPPPKRTAAVPHGTPTYSSSGWGAPSTMMLFILIGFTGLSRLVFTFEMAVTTSMPDSTFPNTGCLEGPGENQSRLALLATLMKNCEPPELGLPVLAIERVKGALVSREMFSSSMFPPFFRVSVAPVFRFLKVPSAGPPVPARGLFGSFA
mmetsp:Transcript_34969/g.58583  ORF Transcript_34969/g.58583 Transcript_34969/m.58583 type:complete len:215 (-) Transcript_34969:200-844(-)